MGWERLHKVRRSVSTQLVVEKVNPEADYGKKKYSSIHFLPCAAQYSTLGE